MRHEIDNRMRVPRPVAAATRAPLVRDLRLVNVLLIAGALSFFVGYLILNTQAAAKGFAIRAIEKRIGELEDQRQRLDLEVVAVRSMENLSGRVRDLGLVPVQSVDYVSGGPGTVAIK